MSNQDDAMITIATAQLTPLVAALDVWIAQATTRAGQEARHRLADEVTGKLTNHTVFEGMVFATAAEDDAPGGTVTGLFEHRSRTHPSRGQVPDLLGDLDASLVAAKEARRARDHAPPHGYPRPDTEREALAREELVTDVLLGRYHAEPERGA